MSANPYLPRPARILDIRRETKIDYTYRLEWPERPQPGQFFEVSIPRFGEAPISVSDFSDGYLDMTIRSVGHVTDGIFDLHPGDTLYLRGPYGRGFRVEQYTGKHLIIAAGGTGLAPVKGLISHFTERPDELAGFDILLGFKSPDDILFRDEVAAWSERANVQMIVDRATDGWSGNVGLITELIHQLEMSDRSNIEAVIVGPPMMMKFSVKAFLERGLAKEQIWVSYERRMSCGIGKCGHCKINDRYVCLDGPVFNFTEAQWLVD